MSFEGKVVTAAGINVPDGTYNMEFKIYAGGTASGGGTLNWTEDWLVSNSQAVTFTSGTFQVNLGSITAFGSSVDWNSYPLYLSMQIGNSASCTPAGNFTANCGGDTEMKPYILLTSTPYAMNADKLDGIDSSGFVQLSSGSQQTGNINISGTVTSGALNGVSIGSTIQPSSSGALTLSSTGSNALTLIAGAASTWSTTSGALTITSAAAAIWSTAAGNLTLQAGSGTVSLGSSTTLTAGGALAVSAGGTAQKLSLNPSTAGKVVIGGTAPTITTSGATALSLNTGGAAAITLDTGGGAAINIGDVNATSIILGGNTSATITEKVANSSTTAFTLQSAGGTNLLVADTTNDLLYVGGSVSTSTESLRHRGIKTLPADRTGVNGAEYYNTADNVFRCDQNSVAGLHNPLRSVHR